MILQVPLKTWYSVNILEQPRSLLKEGKRSASFYGFCQIKKILFHFMQQNTQENRQVLLIQYIMYFFNLQKDQQILASHLKDDIFVLLKYGSV